MTFAVQKRSEIRRMAGWLQFPPVVAPSADRGAEVFYEISEDFLGGHAGIGRRTPIFQAWAHLVGDLPPINNVARLARGPLPPTLCTLKDAVACFQGLQRPHDKEKNGESVLIYVLNPLVTVIFYPDLACLARAQKVPVGVVLTVQVRPHPPLLASQSQLNGLVTRLEFVSSAPGVSLPADYETRYAKPLWRIK
jgi:hypothetical protein